MDFISCGSFARLSENHTGMPIRMGSSSITTRCAMCAEGRKATVQSVGSEAAKPPAPCRCWRQRRVSDHAHLRFAGGAGGEI